MRYIIIFSIGLFLGGLVTIGYIIYQMTNGFSDWWSFQFGGLAEWFIAADLKSVLGHTSVGSNPTPAAILQED